ncbi:MAG: hypothetical protein TEF_11045 [Rhizobiales bacterium NRL2]|jgi:hypothetical protein|nr:MAG: hypothetical protein TEF_11045 [Rhizobiales bacterium NRL2]
MRREQNQSRNATVPRFRGNGFPRPGPAIGRLAVLPKRPANDNVPPWRAGTGFRLILLAAAVAAAAACAAALT